MTDRLARAHTIHQRILNRFAGDRVTYQDGELTIENVPATPADANEHGIDGDGEVIVGAHDCDWLILRADLVHEGNQVTPRPGATITDSNSRQFEVVNGPNNRPFRWSDTRHVRMRIHTDRIDE